MGNTKSKAAVASVSAQINEIARNTVQSCEISSTQSQTGDIVNHGWSFWLNVKLEQKTDISASCFSDIAKQTQLQNEVINTISNASTADGVALLPAFGSTTSSARTNLTNIIRNKITMSNIQRSYTSIRQDQSIKFTNTGVAVFTNVELTQGAKLFAAAALKELDNAGIFNSIANHVDQKSKATTDLPLNIFGPLTTYAIYFIMFIVMIITGAIAYSFIGDSDDSSPKKGRPDGSPAAVDA